LVRLNDQPAVYTILANQIVLNASGQPPAPLGITPGTVTLKYVSSTNANPANARSPAPS
jgi:hypothetical protein